jgi:hypothetical protein
MKYIADVMEESKINFQQNLFRIISGLKELFEIRRTLGRTFKIA